MTEDAYTSDDLSMVQDMEWFYETSPLAFGLSTAMKRPDFGAILENRAYSE